MNGVYGVFYFYFYFGVVLGNGVMDFLCLYDFNWLFVIMERRGSLVIFVLLGSFFKVVRSRFLIVDGGMVGVYGYESYYYDFYG